MKKRRNSEIDAAPPIGEKLLTLREAADVLRLSTRTLREYLQRREIEGRIIGGRTRAGPGDAQETPVFYTASSEASATCV